MNKIFLLVFFITVLFARASHTVAQDYDYPQGCLFDAKEYICSLKHIPMTRGTSHLPTKVSLKKYCPKVGKQRYLDCTAWACSYSALTILKAVSNGWTNKNLITEFSYSTSFVFNQTKSTEDCSTFGTSIEVTLQLLKEVGSLRHSEFGYDCEKVAEDNDFIIAKHHKIDNYFSLANKHTGQINFQQIKKALVEKKPVITAIKSYNSFSNPSNGKETWDGELDYNRGIHALTIIGYDDELQSFELMNSWGEDWGQNGFIRVKYKDLKNIILAAYIIINDYSKPTTHFYKKPISGQIKFERLDKQKIKIKIDTTNVCSFIDPLKSGDEFRLIIETDRETYLYLIGSDLSNNDQLLFPTNSKENAYIPFRNSEMIFPSLNQWFKLDQVVGKDYLCVLLSKVPIPLTSFLSQLRLQKGSIVQRLNRIKGVSSTLLSVSNIQQSIQFGLKNKSEDVIIVIIEIQHNKY